MPQHNAKTQSYLRSLYAPEHRRFAFRNAADEAFDEWSAKARPELRRLVGLDAIRNRWPDFKASVTLGETEDLGKYERRKGILETEPGFDVPFWYLKPKGPGPHPLALLPHGHYAKHGLDYAAGIAATPAMAKKIAEEDRDVAVQSVQRGFAAIAPATRGFPPACVPDVSDRHGSSNCRSQMMHALLAGRTTTGERLWDLERLIDWAETQTDIDASRVLMMGNSGGGTATLYAAACDQRISVAVASCAFCTFLSEGGAIHHCDCNAVPGVLQFGEFYDIAGLIAPRPLLAVHGRQDPLFPQHEIHRAVEGLRPIYQAAGAPNAFHHQWGPHGHRFYSNLMWPFVEKTGICDNTGTS